MKLLLLIVLSIAAITGAVLVIKGLIAFRRHVRARFGHKIFHIWHIMSILLAALFILLGSWVRSAFDPVSHGLQGVALEALGIGLIAFLLFHNCRKTNAFYGLAGTALEVVVSPALLNVILFCLLMLILGTIGSLTAKPVRDEGQDW